MESGEFPSASSLSSSIINISITFMEWPATFLFNIDPHPMRFLSSAFHRDDICPTTWQSRDLEQVWLIPEPLGSLSGAWVTT